MRRWIMIANATQARVHAVDEHGELQLVRTLKHDRSRARTGQMGSDQPGRLHKGMSSSMRSSMQPRTELHQHEMDRFAAGIAAVLQSDLDQHQFDALAVFAAPRFLGRLRTALSEQVQRRVESFVATDCTRLSAASMKEHVAQALPNWLAPAAAANA